MKNSLRGRRARYVEELRSALKPYQFLCTMYEPSTGEAVYARAAATLPLFERIRIRFAADRPYASVLLEISRVPASGDSCIATMSRLFQEQPSVTAIHLDAKISWSAVLASHIPDASTRLLSDEGPAFECKTRPGHLAALSYLENLAIDVTDIENIWTNLSRTHSSLKSQVQKATHAYFHPGVKDAHELQHKYLHETAAYIALINAELDPASRVLSTDKIINRHFDWTVALQIMVNSFLKLLPWQVFLQSEHDPTLG
jgi:hypothetical protein